MNQKRVYKTYTQEFKKEAVALVTDQGYSVAEAARSLGVNTNTCFTSGKNSKKLKPAVLRWVPMSVKS